MIVQITPPAIANIGWKTYIIFAVLNATFVPIIYVFFPETKRRQYSQYDCDTLLIYITGLELEDVDRLFAKAGSNEAHDLYAAKDTIEKVENMPSKTAVQDCCIGAHGPNCNKLGDYDCWI